MTLTDEQLAELDRMLQELRDPSLPGIDFDAVVAILGGVREQLAASGNLRAELTLLRDDYLARIGGMVKAMAVADRRHDRQAEALTFIEELAGVPSSRLISEYRRVAARFRDTFPANARQALTFSRATS